MTGYQTRVVTICVGGQDYSIRALSDLQQFSDHDGAAERAGISSALWSLFGQVWPSGQVLAQAMSRIAFAGMRILEIGCGLGLSSLVLRKRGADITASDHHPLAESFLAHNARLNGLATIAYRDLPWEIPDATLGRFDLIIGSDILYERGHAGLLSGLVSRHAEADGQIILTDPGRGNSASFTRELGDQGFGVSEQRSRFNETDIEPFRGRLLSYRR